MDDPAVAHAFTGGVFVLMLWRWWRIRAGASAHLDPEAMAAPTPVSALLHAACYVKAGVYLACRMHSFGAWPVTADSHGQRDLGMDRHRHHGRGRDVRDGAERSEAYAGLLHGQPDRLHDDGHRHRHTVGDCAGLLHCLNHGFFKAGCS